MPPLSPPTDPDIRDSTVYWFFVLETARKRLDFPLAQQCLDELGRLGVQVKFGLPQKPRPEGRPNRGA
jgi:hypothetical protein